MLANIGKICLRQQPALSSLILGNFTGHASGAANVTKLQRLQLSTRGRTAGVRDRLSQLKAKEVIFQQAPGRTAQTAANIGQLSVVGASALGIAALCYYGLSQHSAVSAMDKVVVWPDYVKERISATYAYFGLGLGVTAGTAIQVYRSPRLLRLVGGGGLVSLLGGLAAIIGTNILCHSLPYTGASPSLKHAAWLLHCGVLGAVIAPICFIGGPILARAALYTTGVIGGLSSIAICAPSEKFLYMGGALGMGLGVVLVSSIGSMFLSPVSALGGIMYSISLYGGLVLFSGFLLYDTQKIIHKAESTLPENRYAPAHLYDPINSSMGIYADTLNIFIRIATILSGGNNRKR